MFSRFVIVASLLWTSSAFAQLYSAVAYSPSTARFGYAAGERSADSASNDAIRACGGYDCEVAGLVENGFVALSMSRSGYVYVGASSNSKEEAIAYANQACLGTSRRGRCVAFAWAGAVCQGASQPSYPAPQYPAPQYPAPQRPAPQYPAPQYPTPQPPAAQYPTPQQPSPQYPPVQRAPGHRAPKAPTYATPGAQPVPVYGPPTIYR